jgi:hypothetical protein
MTQLHSPERDAKGKEISPLSEIWVNAIARKSYFVAELSLKLL